MVELVYTENAPRRQQFHVAPAMQQPKSVDIKNTRYKMIQSLIQNHTVHVRNESAQGQRLALHKSDAQ